MLLQYEVVFPNFNIHAICNPQENVWLQFFLLNLSFTDFRVPYTSIFWLSFYMLMINMLYSY